MATTEKTGRKPNAAFMKPLTPSPTLAAVIGNEAVPRTEVTKRIWDYIKKHNLQDPANRRNSNADAKLRPLFGKAQVSMFERTKPVSRRLEEAALRRAAVAAAPAGRTAGSARTVRAYSGRDACSPGRGLSPGQCASQPVAIR